MSKVTPDKKREAARLYAQAGLMPTAVSKRVGIHFQTIRKWIRTDPEFQQWVEQHRNERKIFTAVAEAPRNQTVQDRIEAMCHAAVDMITTALGGGEVTRLQLEAAEMILDRAGYSKKSDTKVTSNVLTTDDVAKVKERLLKAKQEYGN